MIFAQTKPNAIPQKVTMRKPINIPGYIMRGDVHGAEFLGVGIPNALEVGVEDLLEARPQQQRDAVKQRVQHGDAPALHHQS